MFKNPLSLTERILVGSLILLFIGGIFIFLRTKNALMLKESEIALLKEQHLQMEKNYIELQVKWSSIDNSLNTFTKDYERILQAQQTCEKNIDEIQARYDHLLQAHVTLKQKFHVKDDTPTTDSHHPIQILNKLQEKNSE